MPKNTNVDSINTPQNLISKGRELLDSGLDGAEVRKKLRRGSPEPVVSARVLSTGITAVNPPEPQRNMNDGSRMDGTIRNVVKDTQEFIRSESEASKERDRIANMLGGQTFDASEQRGQVTEEFGVSRNLSRLQDIQTQLASANTQSDLRKLDIESGGQGVTQGQRSLTLEDRQNAVRNQGLAAEAAVLQGNIETSNTLINQAMTDFYADRQLKNQNMIQQLEFYSGIVDDETGQLLRKEERIYQEDIAKTRRVQSAIDEALKTGSATPNEIAKLTNPNTTDNERLALAQLIQANGASEMRNMDLAVKAEQLAKLREPVVATRDTSIIETGGRKQLVDTQTGEVIATFGNDVSTDEIAIAKDTLFVNTLDSLKNHPGMAKAVGTTGLARFTPLKIDVMSGHVSDFVGSVENVVKGLTLNTFAEAKEKGLTFGAMSEGEWRILGQSATKIAQWRREREDGSIYYDTSESSMNKELDVLANFGKMSAIRKGVDPMTIGVMPLSDGKYATKNSDGTITEFSLSEL